MKLSQRILYWFPLMLLMLMVVVAPAHAQDNHELNSGAKEWGVWAGYSFSSPTLLGTATNRQYANAGLRFGYIFATKGPVAFEYYADLVPAAILIQPPGNQLAAETGNLSLVGKGRTAVYGFGISPAGFKFDFIRRNWVQPYFAVNGGVVYSMHTIPIPVANATHQNFTFESGGGAQFVSSKHKALMLGYKWDHISNAFRTSVNPGVDSNVFYAGFSLFK